MRSGKCMKTLTASWKLQSLCWRSLKFLARYVCMFVWMDGWMDGALLNPSALLSVWIILWLMWLHDRSINLIKCEISFFEITWCSCATDQSIDLIECEIFCSCVVVDGWVGVWRWRTRFWKVPRMTLAVSWQLWINCTQMWSTWRWTVASKPVMLLSIMHADYLPRAWLDLRKSSEFSSPNTGWFSPLSLLPSPSLSHFAETTTLCMEKVAAAEATFVVALWDSRLGLCCCLDDAQDYDWFLSHSLLQQASGSCTTYWSIANSRKKSRHSSHRCCWLWRSEAAHQCTSQWQGQQSASDSNFDPTTNSSTVERDGTAFGSCWPSSTVPQDLQVNIIRGMWRKWVIVLWSSQPSCSLDGSIYVNMHVRVHVLQWVVVVCLNLKLSYYGLVVAGMCGPQHWSRVCGS